MGMSLDAIRSAVARTGARYKETRTLDNGAPVLLFDHGGLNFSVLLMEGDRGQYDAVRFGATFTGAQFPHEVVNRLNQEALMIRAMRMASDVIFVDYFMLLSHSAAGAITDATTFFVADIRRSL